MKKNRQDFSSHIRSLAITAIFSDPLFFEKVVLKGGNALAIGLGISSRSSLDLDFSISSDFTDVDDAQERLRKALVQKFDSEGFVVFDYNFFSRPVTPRPNDEFWGGYQAEFKVATQETFDSYSRLEDLRLRALTTGPGQLKKFTIDLSKYEYTEGKVTQDFDHQTIYVYTPRMIAIEKLRAICQQMPAYDRNKTHSPRARDFYDIHLVVTRANVSLTSADSFFLAKNIFAAKEVSLSLLLSIKDFREFHRPDWDSVRVSTNEDLLDFDYYFDFVCEQVLLLKANWNV
jgi:Nucleotidyl transferase AbiEii toxin, Type IV TA system